MKISSKLNELKPTDLNCNVFDVYSYDGLSMQELLCQFFTKINECIKVSNETIDLASWLVNEGLKIEVVNKLMIWLEDGTLENLINVNLFNTLNTKIDNISSQLAHIEKKEFVSIMDYGAIGDKINDDTQAIINALSKGRYVTAKGEKHYLISDEIIIPEHVTLDFNNAYVTFINKNACFNLKKSSSIKNVRININSDVILSKSVIYIDGNEVFNVGWSHTPTVENITIEQSGGIDYSSYRANIGIWLDASQNVKNTRCCITGVLVQNVKAVLLKHIIYMSSSEAPNNQNNVFITSNTFRNIFGYNCACFIKDEVLYNNSGKVGVGSNVYENLHFQPADDIETCYVDICGDGNSFLNPIFWDNSRPLNDTNQIIIRGSHNHISGPKIPPYKSSYVNVLGHYNYYHGNTYGTPTQYYGGKYITGRGYQKEWKNNLMSISYNYDRFIKEIRSGLIEGSNDVKSIDMPLTFGDLGYGYTKITFNSIGVCDKTTQTRRFYLGYYNSNFKCGVNTGELYASQYNFKGEYIIRKYEEGYADVVISIKCIVNDKTFTKVHNERHYNINDDMDINPRLLIGSTNEGGLTQVYNEIKIDFHE